MKELTTEEKSLVWAVRKASEAARHTRKRFLTIVSNELDKPEFDPARRPLVFEFARKQADSSALLASNTVAEGARPPAGADRP
jgi:hypothetical protein